MEKTHEVLYYLPVFTGSVFAHHLSELLTVLYRELPRRAIGKTVAGAKPLSAWAAKAATKATEAAAHEAIVKTFKHPISLRLGH
ncbi:MAG TPA: hypothetical protein VLT51_00965, partial [Anaerolineales bacterium]|nr:hypothetical protein [Anaerolineales bacterium]